MAQIATLTLNPAVDKYTEIDQVVAERKLRCSVPARHPGGGGINVARAAAELGGSVVCFWTCGGAVGQLLKQLLDDEGIDHRPIPVEAMTRENLIVYENTTDRQYRFGMPGAPLTEQEIEQCIQQLKALDPRPEFFVFSGSLPPKVDKGLYAKMIEAVCPPCRVILDTSGDALRLGLKAPVFLIKPNIRELGLLAGRDLENDAQIQAAAKSLIDDGAVQAVVTSLGSGGAFLTTKDEHVHVRAPTVRIRSKVGAGDSFVAGALIGFTQGKSLQDAVRYGVAAGSAAVMTAGSELCRREDVERLFQEMTP